MTNSNEIKKIYLNIKKRRNDIGMSQSELAKAVGYSDKTMISKIERGIIDLPLPKLNAIAYALGTSTASLFGWEDMNNDLLETRLELESLDEQKGAFDTELITRFHILNNQDQELIVNMINSLLSKY